MIIGHRGLPVFVVVAVAMASVLLTACSRAGGEDSEIGDAADYVFDESVIRTYEVLIDDADWERLNDDPTLEQYVPATLLFEGDEYRDVAVRYKGFYGALRFCFDMQGNRICKKLSIKLKFSEYDDTGRFYGLKRLNFNSMETDASKMHDVLGYALFREAGVPAPRATYAKLVVNGEPLGLFALVEQIDGAFTRSRFHDEDGGRGNLYKEVWPVHFAPGPYLMALKTNREEDPSVDKMSRFAQALDGATDETFLSVLESWTDIDMLMRYLAVDHLTGNRDGITAWYCVFAPCETVYGSSHGTWTTRSRSPVCIGMSSACRTGTWFLKAASQSRSSSASRPGRPPATSS
jgi:spore coat protein CotH